MIKIHKTLLYAKVCQSLLVLMINSKTIHKSQGASFNNKYTIHEWNRLDRRLKYVALSRATNENNVKIKI
jgi:hypothetical protein